GGRGRRTAGGRVRRGPRSAGCRPGRAASGRGRRGRGRGPTWPAACPSAGAARSAPRRPRGRVRRPWRSRTKANGAWGLRLGGATTLPGVPHERRRRQSPCPVTVGDRRYSKSERVLAHDTELSMPTDYSLDSLSELLRHSTATARGRVPLIRADQRRRWLRGERVGVEWYC